MPTHLIITVIANDRPGIVERLADLINIHRGNWVDSSMSRLAGKFAGILSISVADDQLQALSSALQQLADEGIRIGVETAVDKQTEIGQPLQLNVTGNDRPGIVKEISALLTGLNVNVEKLHTFCESAPMTGELLFNLRAILRLPLAIDKEQVRENLEALSNDLMVEIEEPS